MNYDSLSTWGPAGSRGSLILAFALVFGIASFNDSASAGVGGTAEAKGQSAGWVGASSSGVIVLARKHDNDGKDGKNGNKNGNGSKGDRNWSKNDNKDGNGNGNKNWSKNGNGNNGNKNWSKNDKGWNGDGYKNWNKKNGRKYGKGWGNHNDNWNRNWNHRGYVREWYRKPYYGEFIGGVILGSIFAANGIGVVPYPPAPYLCWYWADPFMYRGYWDYCD